MKRPALWWVLAGAAVLLLLITWSWRRSRLEHGQDARILAAARRYGVDPALIKAVVWRESGFHPRAVGKAGEIGLMQVMDPAAQEWAEAERCYPLAEESLFDPATNTLAGAWYLRKMLQRYRNTDNPVAYALADYNAGRGNVLKWSQGQAATNSSAFLARMTFPGTRDYVASVQARRELYRGDFPAATGPPSK